jgi:hypothetical protein
VDHGPSSDPLADVTGVSSSVLPTRRNGHSRKSLKHGDLEACGWYTEVDGKKENAMNI